MRVSLKDRIKLLIGRLIKVNPAFLRRYYAISYFLDKGNSRFIGDYYYVEIELFNKSKFNIKLRSKSSDIDVFKQIFIDHEYIFISELINKYTPDNKIHTFIDIGANIGLATLYMSTLYQINTVIAVEPDDGNYNLLIHNLENIPSRFIPIKAAIWKDNSILEKQSIRDNRNWSYCYKEKTNADKDIPEINGYTIQQIIVDHDIQNIDILKIDIEGGESQIFGSKTEYSNLLRITNFLAIEIHDEISSRIEIIDLISNYFSIYFKGETLFGVNKKLIK